MKIEQGMYSAQRQEQRLIMSPQMRFSLDVLRLPADAARELIEEQLLENPLLEVESGAGQDESEFFAALPLDDDEHVNFSSEKAALLWEENTSFQVGRKAEWQGELYDFQAAKTKLSFSGMLFEQLMMLGLDKRTDMLCRYLIDSLDERGYLRVPLEELAEVLNAPLWELEAALQIIQSFEPQGTGARDLKECLLLQLNSYGEGDYAVRIVKEGLEALANRDWKGLAKRLGCDTETVMAAAKKIRSLNPIPSQGCYTEERTDYIIPDALIREENGGFQIVMNRSILPKLTVNPFYKQLLRTHEDPEAKEYMKERNQSAKMVVQAVEERMSTLERILMQILVWQPVFFRDGAGLNPMSLGDLAEELGLHVSTVSRGVQNKYISCVAGTIPLKKLFSTGIAAEGGGTVSNTVVQNMIAKCIAEEDHRRPLSDEKLRIALEDMGVHLARRTVMKYREIMDIPKSSERKKLL